ncbi:MAG: DMT family transporter [Myxococcota bacterium]|nr:DMT family transporter [Myxococcota bacterium]
MNARSDGRPSERAAAYACVALAAGSWGVWPLLLRRIEAVGDLPSALESTVVMGVITLVSALAMTRDRTSVRAPRRARAWLVGLGVCDALNVLLFFAAYKHTVAEAVVTHYLMPVFVALAAPIILREKMTARSVFAISLSFTGLVVMLARGSGAPAREAVVVAAELGTASAVFYAAMVIGNKVVAGWYSTSEATFWHGLIATAIMAAFVPPGCWSAVDRRAVALLFAVSFGPGALAGLIFVWGLRRMPAAHASTLTLLEPLVAVFVGAVFFREELGLQTIAGGALILLGALLILIQGSDRSAAAQAGALHVSDDQAR